MVSPGCGDVLTRPCEGDGRFLVADRSALEGLISPHRPARKQPVSVMCLSGQVVWPKTAPAKAVRRCWRRSRIRQHAPLDRRAKDDSPENATRHERQEG